jgi:periplasmic divalent cation tolerance protein
MSGEIIVLVTSPQQDLSEAIAHHLVEEGLAACVNVVPGITSIYKWQNEVQKETEQLLVIKSHERLWESLEKRIKELHSYDVPEIVSVPLQNGFQPYLEWMNANLRT